MDRKLCKLIGRKLEQYRDRNIVDGLQTDSSRELMRLFWLYSLSNAIGGLDDIPRKYDPIFQE